MNTNHIFHSALLSLATIIQVAAMDRFSTSEALTSLDHFSLEVTDANERVRIFRFDTYSFATLTEEEQNAFDGIFDLENAINNLGDEEIAIKHMEAKMKQSWEEKKAVSQKRLELAKKNIQENGGDLAKARFWLIWESDELVNKKPIAQLGLAPSKIEKYMNSGVLQLGLHLHKDHRKQSLGELIIPAFLKFLRTFTLYKNSMFGFATTSIDSETRAMAEVLGYKLCGSVPWKTLLADGKTEHSMELDLFVEHRS